MCWLFVRNWKRRFLGWAAQEGATCRPRRTDGYITKGMHCQLQSYARSRLWFTKPVMNLIPMSLLSHSMWMNLEDKWHLIHTSRAFRRIFFKNGSETFKLYFFNYDRMKKKDECNLYFGAFVVLKVHKSHLSIKEVLDIRKRSDQVQPSVLHESSLDKKCFESPQCSIEVWLLTWGNRWLGNGKSWSLSEEN